MIYFSDVFPFSLHRVQDFIQNTLFLLLSSVNVFTHTKKGQQFGEIFNNKIFILYMQINFHNLISISFHDLHSIYKFFKKKFCKKMAFCEVDFSLG